MQLSRLGDSAIALVAVALLAGCGSVGTGTTGALPLSETHDARLPNDVSAQSLNKSGFRSIFSFDGTDGAIPEAALTKVNGALYGTTEGGGASGVGVVFKISSNGTEHVLYNFKGKPDGANPEAGLLNLKGNLYGTTSSGGANNTGTVFEITASGAEKVLHSFGEITGSSGDGIEPAAGLIAVKGDLYGTTPYGGAWGYGTVFKMTASESESVLYSFQGSPDGANPSAGLTYLNGSFYGVTAFGGKDTKFCIHSRYGATGCGTVFAVTASGTETVIHDFIASTGDGIRPLGTLLAWGGVLYGTTYTLGPNLRGTVFSITTSGNENILYGFSDKSGGGNPAAGVIDVKGTLYGTTVYGPGTYCSPSGDGCGTVFALTLSGQETTLKGFYNYSEGAFPRGGLTDFKGKLYGTTQLGGGGGSTCTNGSGPVGCGTVFRVSPL